MRRRRTPRRLGTYAGSVGGAAVRRHRQRPPGDDSYPGDGKSEFSRSYDTSYDTAPTLAAVTGTFKGTSATNIGANVALDNVTLTADAAGNITGTGTHCTFTGTIKPRAKGNVYDVGLTFGPGDGCAYPNASATGLGVMTGNVIHAFVQTPSKSGVLFVGTK
ncbi:MULTISPECIES: hypothetical protein [unclassified Caballeronia]|uniref:hypothetical protein n=1 Tax=unclassified Caballeronia TaxID=2646786 RepID=UPI0028667C21|nr:MULTISPECIES: hypothetical protein [unclassified Caballeronia]MDR5753801.1 hypothetical protein [Caballeronia sp. LZ024]MDR5840180.1 hypothetical protein [Caballeronia sp. LZ031]